ncbi:MAG TPA: serine/threonine-protein kinase, partial [Candidatus Baltobacteraceae bacterium]
MSRLLDEALPLDETGRRLWLENLSSNYAEFAGALTEALLAAPAESASAQRLATLPKFDFDHDAEPIAATGLQPGDRVGPYALIRLLGSGGMAEVWLARRADGIFKREVALKLPLLSRMRRDLEQRFIREREILASLNHPNIARLFDAGFADDGQPYFALEYVDGAPFTTHCDDRRLSLRARLELFRQVLSAVQYAHAHLVIHRDLKPSNILVTGDGQVRLLDFGIAKLLIEGEAKETELTRVSGRALTPEYAAPEQIAGAPITTATDVYALGVMLYDLLTGQRPYRLKRDSRGALEEAILQAEPLPPSRVAYTEPAAQARATTSKKLARTIKGDLDTITCKALKKLPNERYATADAFGEDLARFLRGDAVIAQRDTVAYRALKFTRRHWVALATASLLFVTLAGGLAATSYEAAVASKQRDAVVQAQWRSLTQTAAGRVKENDIAGAMGIILEVLPHSGVARAYTPEALSVFQEARAADAQVSIISGHTDRVIGAGFSPDGRRIVTASYDRSARIWDAETGQELLQLKGHTEPVLSAAFSPDGRYIVTASLDKTARIWDAATGRNIMELTGGRSRVWSAAFSPDGLHVIVALSDNTARIYDA